jgi:tRNA (guanine10-N2)-dimethyltransferase
MNVLHLSGENLGLAVEEALALAGKKKFELVGNLLILDAKFDFRRLAYSKAAYDLLFICRKSELKSRMEGYAWHKIYKKDFCVRAFGGNFQEKDLAGYVWRSLKKPKVNLANAKTSIHIFIVKNRAAVCLLKRQIKHKFGERKAHLRAAHHPSSLHPKLARAMVNLTGIKKGKIFDPFCGTGGILIEAGLMGLNTEGYDIDERMLEGAEKNLKSFGIRKYTLKKADSAKLKKAMAYVVTDLPYGRNTTMTKNLYDKFLPILKKSKIAVVGFPDFIRHKKIIKKAGLKIKNEFTYYLHKSLSKKIAVLTR